jgi:hypothetical protein
MTDRIEPALTSEEWKHAVECGPCDGTGTYLYENDPPGPCPSCDGTGRDVLQYLTDRYFSDNGGVAGPDDADLPKFVALANAALKDDDKRKVTWKKLSDMKNVSALARDALKVYGDEATWGNVPRTLAAMIDRTEAFAAALEAYLPPE